MADTRTEELIKRPIEDMLGAEEYKDVAMRPPGCYVLIGVLGLLAWAGCDGSSFGDESRDQLRQLTRQQRALWQAEGYDAYKMTYQLTCTCPAEEAGPFEVFVSDGARDSVLFGGAPVPRPLTEFFTVESLFDFIEEGLDADPDRTNLRFDPERGFPSFVFFDHDVNQTGEEDVITVTDVVNLTDDYARH